MRFGGWPAWANGWPSSPRSRPDVREPAMIGLPSRNSIQLGEFAEPQMLSCANLEDGMSQIVVRHPLHPILSDAGERRRSACGRSATLQVS